MASLGLAVFAVDLAGHGYSEGERAVISDFEEVITDLVVFAETLFQAGEEPATALAGIPPEALAPVRTLPVVVTGISMGGMLALCVTQRLEQGPLKERLRGAVMLCPALAVDLPPAPVQALLRWLVAPLFGKWQIPGFIHKLEVADCLDMTDEHMRQIAANSLRDCAARFPGEGLGWQQNMRWCTASAFSLLFCGMEQRMTQVGFPFLVVHDPADKVCAFSGSERLMQLSPSKDKKLVSLDAKGLHMVFHIRRDACLAELSS